MGLGDCEGCWDSACCCEDGKGWAGYPLYRLVQIQAVGKHGGSREARSGRVGR